MMKSHSLVILASIWTFLGCGNKRQNVRPVEMQSVQDASNKKVKQKIFKEEAEFSYSDFYDLKHNENYDRFFAGNLELPSGEVVCADPLYRELGLPQSWRVAKGAYPVYLYIALQDGFKGSVAYAELNFKDEIPAYWEFSLISESSLANDFEKKMNGFYPVENGLSSFSDYQTWKLYNAEIDEFYKSNKDGNYYNDVLERHFKPKGNIPPSSRGEDWTNYQPVGAKGNVIMFASGLGDGLYPRYIGYNKQGQPVKLVAAFISLAGASL